MKTNEAREKLREQIREREDCDYVYAQVPVMEFNIGSTLPDNWVIDVVYTKRTGITFAIDIADRMTREEMCRRFDDMRDKAYRMITIKQIQT